MAYAYAYASLRAKPGQGKVKVEVEGNLGDIYRHHCFLGFSLRQRCKCVQARASGNAVMNSVVLLCSSRADSRIHGFNCNCNSRSKVLAIVRR